MNNSLRPVRDTTGIFTEIVELYVVPLLHGAVLDGPRPKNMRNAGLASFHTANRIILAIPDSDGRCLILKRSVPFTEEELAFARMVVEKVHADRLHESSAYHLVLCDMVERAIARLLDEDCAETIHRVLRIYNQWAVEGHAGKRVTHATGIHLNTDRVTGSNLFELKGESMVKALCETPDMLLSIDRTGNILGVDQISAKRINDKDLEILAPGALADIATWTNSRHRVAIRLTARGEILIFRNKALVFAKRRSYWRSLPHKKLLERFLRESASSCQRDAGMAAYLTILDLAFSGSGGCIGIVERDEITEREFEQACPGLLFASPEPNRTARMLQAVIKGRKFHQIPRPLRATLCTLDGALIIDREGEILTAGALLRTNGGIMNGGGRTAAARALAERGVGVKVSREGYVEVYDRSDTPILFA